MIWLQNLEKYYRERGKTIEVFRRTNLLIPDGLSIGILGAPGAGKTTLMKLLAGAELPSSGTVEIEGKLLWSKGINPALHPKMTLRQNLRFLCRLYSRDDKEMESMVEKILELSGLHEYAEVIGSKIPAREKALLNHAIIITLDIGWLLLEGFPVSKKNESIHEAMREKIARTSTILASNNQKHLLEYCDAGIVLYDHNLHYFENISEAVDFNKEKMETYEQTA